MRNLKEDVTFWKTLLGVSMTLLVGLPFLGSLIAGCSGPVRGEVPAVTTADARFHSTMETVKVGPEVPNHQIIRVVDRKLGEEYLFLRSWDRPWLLISKRTVYGEQNESTSP